MIEILYLNYNILQNKILYSWIETNNKVSHAEVCTPAVNLPEF